MICWEIIYGHCRWYFNFFKFIFGCTLRIEKKPLLGNAIGMKFLNRGEVTTCRNRQMSDFKSKPSSAVNAQSHANNLTDLHCYASELINFFFFSLKVTQLMYRLEPSFQVLNTQTCMLYYRCFYPLLNCSSSFIAHTVSRRLEKTWFFFRKVLNWK